MTSTSAHHDHDVFAREETTHSVIQTTVQRLVILGFQNGLRSSRISTNVFPQAFVVVEIIKLSAVDHPYWTTVALSRVVVLETANKLVVVCPCVQFFSCDSQNSWRRCVDQEDCSKFASPQLTIIVSAWSTLLGFSQLRTLTIACVRNNRENLIGLNLEPHCQHQVHRQSRWQGRISIDQSLSLTNLFPLVVQLPMIVRRGHPVWLNRRAHVSSFPTLLDMLETLTKDVSSPEFHVNARTRVSACQIPAVVWPWEFSPFQFKRHWK